LANCAGAGQSGLECCIFIRRIRASFGSNSAGKKLKAWRKGHINRVFYSAKAGRRDLRAFNSSPIGPSVALGTKFVSYHNEADNLNTRVLCGRPLGPARHQLRASFPPPPRPHGFLPSTVRPFLFLRVDGEWGDGSQALMERGLGGCGDFDLRRHCGAGAGDSPAACGAAHATQWPERSIEGSRKILRPGRS